MAVHSSPLALSPPGGAADERVGSTPRWLIQEEREGRQDGASGIIPGAIEDAAAAVSSGIWHPVSDTGPAAGSLIVPPAPAVSHSEPGKKTRKTRKNSRLKQRMTNYSKCLFVDDSLFLENTGRILRLSWKSVLQYR